MNAWSHLPNAPLVDWVIESSKTDPEKWDEAWHSARIAAQDEALNAAWEVTWEVARNELDAAWAAALNAALSAAYNAARGAIIALIAYDDCDQYLNMTYDQLLAWALLSETPQAILLLPLKWIQEHECMGTLA